MIAVTTRLEAGRIRFLVGGNELRVPEGDQIHGLLNRVDLDHAKASDFLDVLDYALGGLYSLMCAKALGYEDRQEPYKPEQYWKETLIPRARDMSEGWVRLDGKWAAGLHFNSALVRMDATHERAEALASMKQRRGKKGRTNVDKEPPWCADQNAHKLLVKVWQEVGPLKHKPLASAGGHKVRFEDGLGALRELVSLLETVGDKLGLLRPSI